MSVLKEKKPQFDLKGQNTENLNPHTIAPLLLCFIFLICWCMVEEYLSPIEHEKKYSKRKGIVA